MTIEMVRFLALLLLVGMASPAAARTDLVDSCEAHRGTPPKYRVVRKSQYEKYLELKISLAPRDVSRDNLIAVSCELGRANRKQKMLVVWIFNSHRAAKRWWFPESPGGDPAMVGEYYFDRDKRTQQLHWIPDPRDQKTFVFIDLGEPPPL